MNRALMSRDHSSPMHALQYCNFLFTSYWPQLEHVKTMKACQDESVQHDIIARREEGPRIGL